MATNRNRNAETITTIRADEVKVGDLLLSEGNGATWTVTAVEEATTRKGYVYGINIKADAGSRSGIQGQTPVKILVAS